MIGRGGQFSPPASPADGREQSSTSFVSTNGASFNAASGLGWEQQQHQSRQAQQQTPQVDLSIFRSPARMSTSSGGRRVAEHAHISHRGAGGGGVSEAQRRRLRQKHSVEFGATDKAGRGEFIGLGTNQSDRLKETYAWLGEDSSRLTRLA
jgi:hypothetical protein